MTDTESFMRSVLDEIPILSDLYREHAAGYDEMLPHVLLGDVTRTAMEWADEARDRIRNRSGIP